MCKHSFNLHKAIFEADAAESSILVLLFRAVCRPDRPRKVQARLDAQVGHAQLMIAWPFAVPLRHGVRRRL